MTRLETLGDSIGQIIFECAVYQLHSRRLSISLLIQAKNQKLFPPNKKKEALVCRSQGSLLCPSHVMGFSSSRGGKSKPLPEPVSILCWAHCALSSPQHRALHCLCGTPHNFPLRWNYEAVQLDGLAAGEIGNKCPWCAREAAPPPSRHGSGAPADLTFWDNSGSRLRCW